MRSAHPYVASGVSVNKGNGSRSDVLRIKAKQSNKMLVSISEAVLRPAVLSQAGR